MANSDHIEATVQTNRQPEGTPHYYGRRGQFEQAETTFRFLSLAQVLNRVSVSRSTLYANIKDPTLPFPSPVHIGRRSVWIEHEVEAYMRAVVETSRNVPPNTATGPALR